MKAKRCTECGKAMRLDKGALPNGVPYQRWVCACGESVLDMEQLHELAEAYKKWKRHHVKVSKWGGSLGIRIPKELVKQYKIKANDEVALIPEKHGMRIVST